MYILGYANVWLRSVSVSIKFGNRYCGRVLVINYQVFVISKNWFMTTARTWPDGRHWGWRSATDRWNRNRQTLQLGHLHLIFMNDGVMYVYWCAHGWHVTLSQNQRNWLNTCRNSVFGYTPSWPECIHTYICHTNAVYRCRSSGAVWGPRWPSWAVRPSEPRGFRGRKAILYNAHALVSACP